MHIFNIYRNPLYDLGDFRLLKCINPYATSTHEYIDNDGQSQVVAKYFRPKVVLPLCGLHYQIISINIMRTERNAIMWLYSPLDGGMKVTSQCPVVVEVEISTGMNSLLSGKLQLLIITRIGALILPSLNPHLAAVLATIILRIMT